MDLKIINKEPVMAIILGTDASTKQEPITAIIIHTYGKKVRDKKVKDKRAKTKKVKIPKSIIGHKRRLSVHKKSSVDSCDHDQKLQYKFSARLREKN